MSPSQLDMLLLESGMVSDVASDLATLLAPLADPTEIPTPSADLLALFGEGPGVEPGPGRVARTRPRRRPGRKRGALAGAVVLAISAVGATGLSAAANTLPSPWQSQVSDFSHHFLPFHFPEPRTRFAHGRGALGADADHARTAGKHRLFGERRGVSVTEGSRSLSGDREVSHKRLSRSGQPRTQSPATMSTAVPRGPRTATASPSAAPAFMVKSGLALHSEGGAGEDEPRGFWQGSSQGFVTGSTGPPHAPSHAPSKTPSKAPSKAPSKVPSKAPSKAPATPPTTDVDQAQKPDKGHDPVVGGLKGPQKGPTGGPSSGPEPDPSDDPSATPGAGDDHQGDGSSESPPVDQTDPGSQDGAGQDTGDHPVHDPAGGLVDRGVLPEGAPTLECVASEAAVALGGH